MRVPGQYRIEEHPGEVADDPRGDRDDTAAAPDTAEPDADPAVVDDPAPVVPAQDRPVGDPPDLFTEAAADEPTTGDTSVEVEAEVESVPGWLDGAAAELALEYLFLTRKLAKDESDDETVTYG